MQMNVQCLLCKQVLVCDKSDTRLLLEHVKEDHPRISYTYCRKATEKNSEMSNESKQIRENTNHKRDNRKGNTVETSLSSESLRVKSKEVFHSISNQEFPGIFVSPEHKNEPPSSNIKKAPNTEPRVTRKYECHKEFIAERPRNTFYKTTIEHNKKGIYKIRCPNCESKKSPIIFCHKETVTKSSFLSTMMIKCWASCFLPSIFPPPSKEYIKCSQCGYFLGVYNHQKQIVGFKKDSQESKKEKQKLLNK